MRLRLFHVLMWLGLATAPAAFPAAAQEKSDKLNVVATFSILADFARNVGGDRVNVTALVGPDGDVHVYTPTAADAGAVRQAKLVILNGLGLEGWLPRLVKSSGSKAATVIASDGIAPRKIGAGGLPGGDHDAGSIDPHAWQSVPNAERYVANIRDAMAAADPDHAANYKVNAAAYLAELEALDRKVRAEIGRIPQDRRTVISTHAAFGYFAAAYGIAFLAPEGVSTDSEPSARDIAAIIEQIRKQKIPAVFLENISDPRLMRRIAAETGARIGGTLYSDSLTDRNGAAPSYIKMILHNTQVIVAALSG